MEFGNCKRSTENEKSRWKLLNQNNIAALHDAIVNELLPAYEKGQNKDVGVFTNRNKTQMFEAMVIGGEFFVCIHDEIENRIPKNTYMFKFDKTDIVEDYDPKAVSCKITQVDAQFTLFVKCLEAFENLGNGITAHEYQVRQSYFVDQIRQYLNALNTKLNLGISRPSYNNSSNSNSGGFDSGNYSSSNPNPVAVREGSMNDLFGNGDELPFA